MGATRFLLAGNGLYNNRGCEAIIRGTVQVLSGAFGADTLFTVASFGEQEDFKRQQNGEADPRVSHFLIRKSDRKLSAEYLKSWLNRKLKIPLDWSLYELPQEETEFAAALEVGGDNYSLDYSLPMPFLRLDRKILERGLPLVHWGSSIGPFSSNPDIERKMAEHLKKFTVIYVRETRSRKYLESLGLRNLVQVADPAFLMEPVEVPGLELPGSFIGLNFSRHTAKRGAGGELDSWTAICADVVERVSDRTGMPVVLIPHVYSFGDKGRFASQDRQFMREVLERVRGGRDVSLLSPDLGAAQVKWVISKSQVFAGARTHSTIAAISTCVPTISLAYSMKAFGINEDVFGSLDYCIDVKKMGENPDELPTRIARVLEERSAVAARLNSVVPGLKMLALKAGEDLKARLGGGIS